MPYVLPESHTNPHSCKAAVDAVGEILDKAVKPVLLAGGCIEIFASMLVILRVGSFICGCFIKVSV